MNEELKNLRIIDITTYHPIKEKLGNLSRELEFKVNHPESQRLSIEDIHKKLKSIIDLVEKL